MNFDVNLNVRYTHTQTHTKKETLNVYLHTYARTIGYVSNSTLVLPDTETTNRSTMTGCVRTIDVRQTRGGTRSTCTTRSTPSTRTTLQTRSTFLLLLVIVGATVESCQGMCGILFSISCSSSTISTRMYC